MSSSRGAGGADDHLCAMSPCEITGRQEAPGDEHQPQVPGAQPGGSAVDEFW
jgi:hypothetical protein